MENQQKEQLRKEFEIQYANHPANLFEWFWKRLEEKETELKNTDGYLKGHVDGFIDGTSHSKELLKAADEVINQVAAGFTGYNDALEKYNSLKYKY